MDYAGHVFGNIFLVGDAAGLVGDWTGYGIYPAWASGEEVAQAILQGARSFPRIQSLLAAKRLQRRLIRAFTLHRFAGRSLLAFLPLAFKIKSFPLWAVQTVRPRFREKNSN